MPAALCRLFAVVLIFCQASDPRGLLEQQYMFLSEDYARKYPDNPARMKELTVASVEEYLQAVGKSLRAFSLEELQSAVSYDFRVTKDVTDALSEEVQSEFLYYKEKLNEKQKNAFSCIMKHVKEKKVVHSLLMVQEVLAKFFFLYNALFAEVRLMKKIVLPTASSGIAAANLPNGRTTHSRFKIPVDHESSLACDVPKQSSLASLIRETTLIIWDEASMANKSNIVSLDMLLQDLCGNKELFGGKLVVFGGDFKQVLPVVPHKTQREVVEASIASSFLWSQLIKFYLTENQRAREDPLFSSFLLSLGNGDLQKGESDYVRLPEHIVRHFDTEVDLISALITYTFPEIGTGNVTSYMFSKGPILSPLNVDVDLINSHVINEFPGEPVVCKTFDVLLTDN